MVTVRLLGPFTADVAGSTVDLGRPRQRAVLARLLAERGGVVPSDRMIDQLWRGEPSPRAIASLQSCVSNLRRVLEPGRPRGSPATVLVSAAAGYAVRLPDEAVDGWRFAALVRDAQAAAIGDPVHAQALLSEAIGQWRGPAFAEFGDEEWAQAEAVRLDELHVVAQELWAQLCLRTGAEADALTAAEQLTRRYPSREEGWRLLALALWSGDRQADALAALRRARQTLDDHPGFDSAPALARLERAIRRQQLAVLHAAVGAVP